MNRIKMGRDEGYKVMHDRRPKEHRIKQLKTRLRQQIRIFQYQPLLSEGWLKMCDSISQVAEMAFLEMSLPFNRAVTSIKTDNLSCQSGRNEKGTLWDQQDEQLAVRMLLEEGKINLCVALLYEFYRDMSNKDNEKRLITASADKTGWSIPSIKNAILHFEKGLGILVHLAMEHVEVLQILDIGRLLEHFLVVLGNKKCRDYLWKEEMCSEFDAEFLGVDKFQEFLVIHYIANLMKQVDELDEDKIMSFVEQGNLISKVVDHVIALQDMWMPDVLESFFRFLNSCVDCETYSTEDRFLSPDVKSKCIRLTDYFLSDTIAKNGLERRDFRKLITEVESWKKE